MYSKSNICTTIRRVACLSAAYRTLVLGVGVSCSMSPTPGKREAGVHVFHASRLPLAATWIVVKLQV